MFNLMERKVIRDLDPDDIDRLVSVSGMVTRCSNIIPEVRSSSAPPHPAGKSLQVPIACCGFVSSSRMRIFHWR